MKTSWLEHASRIIGHLWEDFKDGQWIPSHKAMIRKFDVFFVVSLNILWNRQCSFRWIGTLRRLRDVTVMISQFLMNSRCQYLSQFHRWCIDVNIRAILYIGNNQTLNILLRYYFNIGHPPLTSLKWNLEKSCLFLLSSVFTANKCMHTQSRKNWLSNGC